MEQKQDNLLEFKELILKYESIAETDIRELNESEKEISYYFNDFTYILKDLTGFSSNRTCTLCNALNLENITKSLSENDCINCIWMKNTKTQCWTQKTYKILETCNTTDELLEAISNRAKYMREIINWYDKEIDYDEEIKNY